MMTTIDEKTDEDLCHLDECGLKESIEAEEQRLVEQQRQLAELQKKHKALLVRDLRDKIRASRHDYISVIEALLPQGWSLSRRRGKLYGRKREPRWRVKGDPNCTYIQGRFSREMQKHMRNAGLNPDLKIDRQTFIANHMERI